MTRAAGSIGEARMSDASERLARQVRDAAGKFNDEEAPVVSIVKWMCGEIERHRRELAAAEKVVEAAEAYIEVMSRPCVESARTRKIHDLINAIRAANGGDDE